MLGFSGMAHGNLGKKLKRTSSLLSSTSSNPRLMSSSFLPSFIQNSICESDSGQ